MCEYLLKEGNYVICLDDFGTGSRENLKKFSDYKSFEIIEHDITNEIFIEVDQIYNLACPASPVQYQYNPIKTLKTSVYGVINMLELAKKCKSTILQASTSEICGNPKVHPQSEQYLGNVNNIGIRGCYDEGKRCAETLMFDYHRQYDVDTRIVRIFNTYGPNMAIDDGIVVSNLIVQALKNENITVYGDGAQTRSFCYVSDLINGMVNMMNNNEGFIGPVNLGNPQEISILDFAKLILNMTGSKSKIVYKQLTKDDPEMRRPDISLATERLNWIPEVDIMKGLSQTIEYFDKKLSEQTLKKDVCMC